MKKRHIVAFWMCFVLRGSRSRVSGRYERRPLVIPCSARQVFEIDRIYAQSQSTRYWYRKCFQISTRRFTPQVHFFCLEKKGCKWTFAYSHGTLHFMPAVQLECDVFQRTYSMLSKSSSRHPAPLLPEIHNVYNLARVRWVLKRIQRLIFSEYTAVAAGDFNEIHMKYYNHKRGKCIVLKSVLDANSANGLISVLGAFYHTSKEALEDLRLAIIANHVGQRIQKSNNFLNRSIRDDVTKAASHSCDDE